MRNRSDYSDPNDSWHSEFPRLAELRDSTPFLAERGFFFNIPASISNSPLARGVFVGLESDLAVLDDDAWSAFKLKLLRCDFKSNGHRAFTAIHSILYEAKGYRYLKHALGMRNVEYDQIVLVRDGGRKTPDWAAVSHGAVVALLEVKTIYESDDQSRYVYDNTKAILERGEATFRRGHPSISDSLWKKLRSTVKGAKRQLDCYAPQPNVLRIAFFLVRLDFDLTTDPTNHATVNSYLDGLGEGMFQVACEFPAANVVD